VRTAITLDADVEILVRTAMRERDLPFKEAVNAGLRDGLRPNATERKSFRQRSFALGGNPDFPWEKALARASEMEDEEMLRKIAEGQ
jgi:Arc/MetJ family transcription regulator